ncbi:LysM domain-containing protein [Cercophora scortea]|uniref:LysM domain-containing protein n=1 Tax=Cercophora scortea TaxID=314031 RepID=A0AAE0J7J0_9PEZI|nr:LysM domain-containing protein [Cercophora scortea]
MLSVWLLASLWLASVQATIYITHNDSFPANTSTSCLNAMMTDIKSCPDGIRRLRPDLYYPQQFLTSVCTTACQSSLGQYESSVVSSCSGQSYDSLSDKGILPMAYIPQFLRYLFNYTCLQDAKTGDYCIVQAASAIGILPDQSNLNSPNMTGGGALNCTDCNLKGLQFRAGTSFSNDDDTVSMYKSLTSSCKATGYPLPSTASTSKVPTATTTTAPTPTCTGTQYTVKAGDTCKSVSKAQSVGTAWLLMDNNLAAFCADFPTSGSLCIQHTCKTYTVQKNDTCESIDKASGISYAQLLAWNPNIGGSCRNLNSSVGYEICVSTPGTPYSLPPQASTQTVTSVTTAMPVPTNAANGSVTNCGMWYEAIPGDYCNLITMRFGLSLENFLILNPEVNENCTNLYAKESYCVEPVGDMASYPGAPGYVSPVPSFATIPWTSLPEATNIPSLYQGNASALANGTRKDCGQYLEGSDYQYNLKNTTFASNCELAVSVYNQNLADFLTWNPSLSAANCSLKTNTRYCANPASLVVEPTETMSAMPTATGVVSNCTQFTYAGSGITCQDICDYWNISLPYFTTLNPSLGGDCAGLKTFTWYCVNTTAPVTVTTSVIPPGPTQSGIPANCNAYYIAQAGDDCGTVSTKFGITTAQFHAWNPAVSADCLSGFWKDEAYCVGVSGGTTTTTSSAKSTIPSSTVKSSTKPTSTASSTKAASSTTASKTSTKPQSTTSKVTPPGPTQSGIAANCNKYYVAQTGDTCTTVETKFGITDKQFHTWNPAVSADCLSGFWKDEAYCVGVSS